MKPELKFEEITMSICELGEEAGVPDLLGSLVLQNNLEFHLGEEEEIYEGFGKRRTSYPYRQYNAYSRKLQDRQVQTAVLENDYIRAVFLPGLGGRLWELTDKAAGKNLLYTNDVIRYSNLAVRNAWFSGGVEWNMGIIGHSPFTAEQLYTAYLEDEDKNPVLRMYEYERLRGVEYQMDFWLGESDKFLNCRMRLVNSGSQVVPMYWWSNMAVPEYKNGRIAVPAEKAYTSRGRDIFKVNIPSVDGVDITDYGTIPDQVDYFFDIPEESPKFIANLDEGGYGLLHISTSRLRSRKLFSWGNNQGSDTWQNFLTKDGGRYVEIQAGLGKTQYGCIPMAPHTAWEWMEQYGAVQIDREKKEGDYEALCEHMKELVSRELADRRPEEVLRERKNVALMEGTLVCEGSGFGSLEQAMRAYTGDRGLSPHLVYSEKEEQRLWREFVETGVFAEQEAKERPGNFMSGEFLYDELKDTIVTLNSGNWYAHYHLAVMEMDHGNTEAAEAEFLTALKLADNAWCHHGLSALYLMDGKREESVRHMVSGLKLRSDDLGYVKEGFKQLLAAKGYEEILELYGTLPETIRQESRILFGYMLSLAETGRCAEAVHLLRPEFVLEDIREGEDSISDLWKLINPEKDAVHMPGAWNFNSL